MKLHLDGTLEGSPEELAAYKHIDAALAAKGKRAASPKPKSKPKKVETEVIEISPILSETLDNLINNGSSSGVSHFEVAKDLGIKPATALWRLNRLVKLGLVFKPSRGMFMPGEES